LKTLYNKKFLKDLADIPQKERISIEKFVFETLVNCKSLNDTNKIEKLRGHENYYKVRFGNYRAGIRIEKDTVILERILHRKEIYRYFP